MLEPKFSSKAVRNFRKLESQTQQRVESTINDLCEEPLPRGCVKLIGEEGFFRIRVGKYRIVYEIDAEEGLLGVVNIDKRSRAYR